MRSPRKTNTRLASQCAIDRIKQKHSSGPQNTADFVDNAAEIGDMLKHVDAHHIIHASIGYRQCLARANEIFYGKIL